MAGKASEGSSSNFILCMCVRACVRFMSMCMIMTYGVASDDDLIL